MNIDYNSCRVAVTAANTPTLALSSVIMLSGRTVQFMLCDSTTSAAGAALASAAGVITTEFNVRSTSTPASTNSLLSFCQLFLPAYTLAPDVEAKYLFNPIKTMVYDDIYQYTVSGIAPSRQFNKILTNGILNPKKLILVPFIQAGTAADRNGCSADQFRSPFDSAPATTGPLVGLSSLQVQVSGKNMWDHPVRYDFENFQAKVSESGINGGQVTGLSSGLISYKMWQYGYRYYICDISRRLSASDNIPLAIQISGQNSSGASIDLYAFVTYERSLLVETASGVVFQ